MVRYLVAVMAALFLPILGAAQCLTTLAPNTPFVPPAPYWADAPEHMFWYGTDQLWTALGYGGKWSSGNNKLTFWRRGFDWRKELEPKLIITAKRLDGDAPSVAVAHANAVFIPSRDAAGMMTLIDIPTAGCWEVTAHYSGHTLPFVVAVGP